MNFFGYLLLVTLFATCSIAFWKGGSAERITAAILFVAAIGTPLVTISKFAAPEFGVLAIDILLLGWLVWLAISHDRFWPLLAAAFHLVGTIVHVVRIVEPTVLQAAYAHGQAFWAYPVFASLVWGVMVEGPASKARQSGRRDD